MPRVGNIETLLPKDVRDWLDQSLIGRQFSVYRQLEQELKARGYNISKTAIHRYGKAYAKSLDNIRIAREQAKAIVETASDDAECISEALIRLVQEKLYAALVNFEPNPDDLNLLTLAKAVAEIAKSSLLHRRFLDEAQKKADDVINNIRKKDIPEDTLKEIEEGIYGLVRG